MQNQKSVWGLSQQIMSLVLASNCLWRTLGVSAGVIGAIAQVAAVQAAVLTQWQFNSAANQLEITVPEGTQPRYFLLAKPARIVLDLPNTQMGAVPAEQTLSGPVQQIRVSQQQTGSTRIVMQLGPNVVFAPGQVKLEQVGSSKTGTRWILRPLIASPGNGNSASTPAASTPAVAAKPTSTLTPASSQAALPPPVSTQPATSAAPSVQRSQPAPSTATSERSQPSLPSSPPKSRITRNAVDLLAPGDRPTDSSSTSSSTSEPASSPANPTATAAPLPTEQAEPAPEATSNSALFTPRLSPAVPATTPASASQPPQSVPSRDRSVAATPAKSSAPPKPPVPPTAIPPVVKPVAESVVKPPATPPVVKPVAEPVVKPPAVPRQPEVAIAPTPAAPTRAEPVTEPQPPVAPAIEQPLETPLAPAKPEVKLTPTPPQPAAEPETAVLPPANFRSQQPVTVSVPSMKTTVVPRQTPEPSDRPVAASPTNPVSDSGLPPAVFTPQPTATVTVPPLPSASALPSVTPSSAPTRTTSTSLQNLPQPSSPTDTDVPTGRVIEFGQPLAATSTTSAATVPPALPALEPETELPTETSNVSSSRTSATVTVPPLPRAAASASSTELDFQRPPDATANPQSNLAPESSSLIAAGNGIVLPSGTTLQLQYPGSEILELKPGTPQQEVLLLQTEIRDRNGSILAPTGAAVIGRFETTSGGSRFIAQAISLQGRNVPLAAESALLWSKSQVSQNKVVRNSALGALAGALVGGSGEEVLGGAAAGAAVTYLASPKPAKLQPGQVLQVRLTEALRSP